MLFIINQGGTSVAFHLSLLALHSFVFDMNGFDMLSLHVISPNLLPWEGCGARF